jgi:hypothetical protein
MSSASSSASCLQGEYSWCMCVCVCVCVCARARARVFAVACLTDAFIYVCGTMHISRRSRNVGASI